MSNQKAKQEIEKDIRLLRIASLALDMLPDSEQFDFPVKMSGTSQGVTSVTYHVRIPYSITALRQYRKAMGKGWKLRNWSTTQHDMSVSTCASFIRPSLSPNGEDYLNPFDILLAMDTELDQSACHIELEKMEEKPVWKVVCQ